MKVKEYFLCSSSGPASYTRHSSSRVENGQVFHVPPQSVTSQGSFSSPSGRDPKKSPHLSSQPCIVPVPGPVLMSSHSRETHGASVDNGHPTSNQYYIPMKTEPITNLALPPTHIYPCRVRRSEQRCQLGPCSFTIHSNSST